MKIYRFPQLYFRLSLGIGYLLAVGDRLGWLGPQGVHGVDWGNWSNFVTYTNVLMPFFNRPTAGFMGLLATLTEVLCGLAFLIGYKIRIAAMISCLLTLGFALTMALFMSVKAPFNYSVFAASAGSLLLYCLDYFPYSIDNILEKQNKSALSSK